MHDRSLIAVVGMDGIFPGAPDLASFWRNIVDGVDTAAPVPAHRWIAPAHDRLSDHLAPDRTYSQTACLIDRVPFDPGDFNLDPDLTRHLDPVHQLTLVAGKRAVAACRTADVDPQRVDTILAAIALPTDNASAFSRRVLGRSFEGRLFSHRSSPDRPPTLAEVLASRVDGLPAALLAAEMDFGGDCFTLDAACAASIYAVKLACDALLTGRADMVVTGGVSRPDCLYTLTGFSQLRALSPSGRCAPFDRRADGLVVGEGVGILVLKRLDDAVAHGDTIHGVIHGIGLSNDMRGNLLAPESAGQLRALQAAYRMARWRPSDVDYIECHGTGTRAGDTAEIESLVRLWKDEPGHPGRCAIGSVKSMIGHLLTAAGAAGMIKTLLALKHRMLPPSIHFERPPEGSPLNGSPFRVQIDPRTWNARGDAGTRRAAVSAFGFGGINAHILFQEWPSAHAQATTADAHPPTVGPTGRAVDGVPLAIVGMDVRVGAIDGLDSFAAAIFHGRTAVARRPDHRWKGAEPVIRALLDGRSPHGAYMDRLAMDIGRFQIPPNEIQAILPQQLLALQTGAAALADAGLALRTPRARMGAIVGMGFDFEATDFHLRWQLYDAAGRWNRDHGLNLDETALQRWLADLRDQCGPPLTPPRVMGALGGIVASRMAREFRLGGPSFVVAADAASGIKALQIAADLLRQDAVDAMLVAAVDLAGDARSTLRMARLNPLSPTNRVRPFDAEADGTLPGDGAAALVIKRLDRALSDGDRIYAVVRGIGAAGGDNPAYGSVAAATYRRALSRCLDVAGVASAAIAYIEAHGSGIPQQDRMEHQALADVFAKEPNMEDPGAAIALGSAKGITGLTGAADGLVSLVKTALCLYHRRLPPLHGFTRPAEPAPPASPLHMPIHAQPWLRDRDRGPRTACCASITTDGACSHVLLQEPDDVAPRPPALRTETQFPLIVSGDTPGDLAEALSRLETMLGSGPPGPSVADRVAGWMRAHPPRRRHLLAMGLIVKADQAPATLLSEARQAIDQGHADRFSRQVVYTSRPVGADARVAWIYPGSGNHYLAMGRDLALRFPTVVDGMDRGTARLKTQFRPWNLIPWRQSWPSGWESDATHRLTADPLNMIFGQVVFGGLMTGVLKRFRVPADALIGYSLGESAALFAHGVWPDRDDMLTRMQATDLFTTQLAGPCHALRRAWGIADDIPVAWRVAVVNRSAAAVRDALATIAHARLLIVNAPDECVIGGLEEAVAQAVSALGCQAVYLDGVVTVHCDAAAPVADAYRELHRFPTTPPPGLDVYSCSAGAPYSPTPQRAADAIAQQALEGFDFTRTIDHAYAAGCRVFIEVGPRSSCTRMIDRILGERPHLAVAANHGNADEIDSLSRCLLRLAVERVPVDLGHWYADADTTAPISVETESVTVTIGGPPPTPTLPTSMPTVADRPATEPSVAEPPPPPAAVAPPAKQPSSSAPWDRILEAARANMTATAEAHTRFLGLSRDLTQAYAQALDLKTRLLEQGAQLTDDPLPPTSAAIRPAPRPTAPPVFDRDMCMEFAVGRVGRVLGPAFDEVDTYRVRVRLPDDPLMLVDRILAVEGEMLSMTGGRVVTEHDVLPAAWYLDGGRAPVCISVEAGQADLFLSAYLGIDHQVKGRRAYRLLDAAVTFHRGLPRPGETIRYTITIDRFARQGDTWMFFFRFDGHIGEEHLITMRDGCAGFFTEAEVRRSGGIILTDSERAPAAGQCPPDWRPPVAMVRESYSDAQLDALRQGDLAGCFGERFQGIRLADSLRLPDGRMRLIDRILDLDPTGGRYGLGLIRAEADIHPDDWFLTCHFVDDMVMPGTLMYECCAHTLRVLLQRMGWVTDQPGACYEPVVGNTARLKCRGPVTPATRHVHYEIQIRTIGFAPEPYVIADAHMFADDRPIVLFKDMSMQVTGLDRAAIEAFWQDRADAPTDAAAAERPLYDRAAILAFATGNPSAAFGEPYRVFDRQRTIARLPGPPYCFIDRVTRVEPPAWELAPDGWVTAQYDIPAMEWYFAADRSGVMPFCVLLEIALQPCGWLAAYAGSALRSPRDLKFRNLGGSAVLHRQVTPHSGTLTMRCRMTKVSEAADMIIEHFDFAVLAGDEPVYTGDTYFGFFSADALRQQRGLGSADPLVDALRPLAEISDGAEDLAAEAPLTPAAGTGLSPVVDRLALPGKALLMIDRIAAHLPDGGASGQGYIRGHKRVDPAEWFFKAHFHQDPVCPGSLGVESFIQLIKAAAMRRWPHLAASHRFRLPPGHRHHWVYRGQIIPTNRNVAVEAQVTRIVDGPSPVVVADGLLSVDGLPIYKMTDFALSLVPALDMVEP